MTLSNKMEIYSSDFIHPIIITEFFLCNDMIIWYGIILLYLVIRFKEILITHIEETFIK